MAESNIDPVDALARTIWGESRGEHELGMDAVANVVMNRVAHPGWWGRDVVGVCLKKFQFSCWLTSDPNLAKMLAVTASDPIFAVALGIARAAIAGQLPDVTHGATHYKVTALPWPHDWPAQVPPLVVIGHHSFYRFV